MFNEQYIISVVNFELYIREIYLDHSNKIFIQISWLYIYNIFSENFSVIQNLVDDILSQRSIWKSIKYEVIDFDIDSLLSRWCIVVYKVYRLKYESSNQVGSNDSTIVLRINIIIIYRLFLLRHWHELG